MMATSCDHVGLREFAGRASAGELKAWCRDEIAVAERRNGPLAADARPPSRTRGCCAEEHEAGWLVALLRLAIAPDILGVAEHGGDES